MRVLSAPRQWGHMRNGAVPWQEVAATLVSTRSTPSQPHATVLGSSPLGIPRAQATVSWRRGMFVLTTQGFLAEEFPGEPALMDTGMCFCGRHCCQPGKVQPSCCFFLLWRALATGGEQPCPITLLPFSSFVFCHSVTHELPELQLCSMLCRAMTEQKREKAHPLLQEAENHRIT